jgi:hypothetical protein
VADLVEIDMKPYMDDLLRRGVITEADLASRPRFEHRGFRHMAGPIGGKPGKRELFLQLTVEKYRLEEVHERDLFGIRVWRHISVSVKGALDIRLADQKANGGRVRGPGERGPAPLPDWYELTHLAYGHAADLGFDPTRAVWQYLPGSREPGLNVAEALHLRQPA